MQGEEAKNGVTSLTFFLHYVPTADMVIPISALSHGCQPLTLIFHLETPGITWSVLNI